MSGNCAWDFGDGSTGIGNPTTHTYVSKGSYNVGFNCGGITAARSIQSAATVPVTCLDLLPWLATELLLVTRGTIAAAGLEGVRKTAAWFVKEGGPEDG